MRRILPLYRTLGIALLLCVGITQLTIAQEVKHLDSATVSPDGYDNIYVEQLNDDTLTSTYLIWVKEHVKEHYHEAHSEVVYVLEGVGRMKLNDAWQSIKAGDYIFIPRGTRHAVEVKSEDPMKVLSVQTPRFDGTDRIFVSQK